MFLFSFLILTKKAYASSYVSTDHAKYTYQEMVNDINLLKKAYPNYMKTNVIGTTADNRNLYEIIIGNPKAKKHMIVIANLHAREYMTTQLCMKQIEYYLTNYNKTISGKKLSDVFNKIAVHYVPSCNPDGTAISQSGFAAIRNTTLRSKLKQMGGSSSTWKANARGVDLNRNWDIAFYQKGTPGSQGYRGPKAASELEVQAIVKMVNRIKATGQIKGVISYHSTGSIMYGRVESSGSSDVKRVTEKMRKIASSLTGYYLMPVETIQEAAGCSREYFLYKRNIPCITLEVGVNPCPLKISEFSSIWKKNKDMIIKHCILFTS